MRIPAAMRKYAGASVMMGLVLIVFIAFYSLWAGYQAVGKTFTGFGIEFSFLSFPVEEQDWTGAHAGLQYYEQIIATNGRSFQNIDQFRAYIESLPPNTPVNYTVLRHGKPVVVTVPTMAFRLTDFFKIFVTSFIVAMLYAGLTLYILLRREKISQSKILLFMTFNFTAVYAMRGAYNYLHQFLSLGLIAYCTFPISLFLLGSHLAKSGTGGKLIPLVEKLNLLICAGLALTLGGLTLYVAAAPFEHAQALQVFLTTYKVLVDYMMVNILGFIGLVLWRSFRRKQEALKNWQARIILIGSLVSFLPYLVMMGAFWVFKMPWSLPSELMATNAYLFILFVTYAILQDEGVALEVFFKKTVFYYILLFLFGMAYAVVNRIVTISIESSLLAAGKEQIPLIAGFVSFVLVSLFNNRLQKLLENVFYRQRKQLKALFEAFIQESTSTLDPQKMVALGLRFLQQAFAPENFALYLSPNLQATGPTTYSRYFVQQAAYPEKLVLQRNPLTTPAQIQTFKQEYGFDKETILPLHKNDVLLGLFVLDKKSSGLGYFSEDLELLKNFAFYFATGFYVACQNQISLAAQHRNESAKRMEVLGTLASGVAHDFNNLLSTIVMSVGLMKYLSEDPQILERLQVIQSQAEKGAEITKALREYTSTLPPAEAVSLREILIDAREQMLEMLPETIGLKMSLPDAGALVLAEPEQLQRVLMELARNAQIAMEGGGLLTLDVQRAGLHEGFAEPDQEYFQIRISDTGIGVPESIASRIFNPFYSAWPEGEGLGLGLSIARQIVKNHHGKLMFESVENQGTTFSLYLPVASPSLSATLPEASRGPALSLTADQPLILLIDDEAELRRLLTEALTRDGYRVVDAANGDQGLNLYQAYSDELMLVVCDMEMPQYDGRYFLAGLRELGLEEKVPILISSGNLSKAEEKFLRQKGYGILAKPYTVESLLAQVQRLQSALSP